MGLGYPSSERGKWPLCLSPIRGWRRICATAEGSTRCWGHKGDVVDGREYDISPAPREHRLTPNSTGYQSINHMWRRQCGSARDHCTTY